jgi:hypothetical protein
MQKEAIAEVAELALTNMAAHAEVRKRSIAAMGGWIDKLGARRNEEVFPLVAKGLGYVCSKDPLVHEDKAVIAAIEGDLMLRAKLSKMEDKAQAFYDDGSKGLIDDISEGDWAIGLGLARGFIEQAQANVGLGHALWDPTYTVRWEDRKEGLPKIYERIGRRMRATGFHTKYPDILEGWNQQSRPPTPDAQPTMRGALLQAILLGFVKSGKEV